MMVPRIAGSEMRLKPRTACTRSSSPGPASTTRATSATPPTHTAAASAWPMPASTPIAGKSPPVRLSPTATMASNGMPNAGSCVVGSMTRSGRMTTQPVAITRTSRAIAARPGQPASARSNHADGLSEAPSERSVASAVNATRNSTVPTSASAHIERRKRTVITYSGPSGHATPISTSAPKMTRMPSVDSTRPSHSAPPVLPSSSVAGRGRRPALSWSSRVSAGGSVSVVTGSFCTENANRPSVIGCSSSSRKTRSRCSRRAAAASGSRP